MKFFKWLLPGLRIKRWILVILLGCSFAVLGSVAIVFYWQGVEDVEFGLSVKDMLAVSIVCFALASFALITGFYRLLKSLGDLLDKHGSNRGLIDIAYERRFLSQGPRIVALGGGTGMSILLSGLKHFSSEITAIVSMADDGGSTGKLRQNLGIVPMGDIRKCLVALADEEPLMRHLMNYRFPEEELEGHSFGNLMLTVLGRIAGDMGEGIKEANRILQVRGRVLPSTLEKVFLVAVHEDGSKTTGQRHICRSDKRIVRLELKPSPAPAGEDVTDAIRNADLIVLGPGSLFTSVMPNLMIKGIPEALSGSDAVKVLVVNVTNSEGETKGFKLEDHIQAILTHTAPFRVFDYVLVGEPLSKDVTEQIKALGAEPVVYGGEKMPDGVEAIHANLIDPIEPTHHDSRKLAQALLEILSRKL